MKGNVGASRHIRYNKTPKDGTDGHTYSVRVTPSSVAVSASGAVVPASLGNTAPTVTLYCDGADVTPQSGGVTAAYAIRRKGVRLTDGQEESVTKTTLREMAMLYSSVCFEMIPNLASIGSTVPVLASATLTFVRNGAAGDNGTNGHTYSITVSPSSVRVGVNGIPTAPDHIHMVPTVTLYCDGKDVTSQGTLYAVHRSGVRASDGVWVETVPDNLTSLGLLGISYDSVRFDMVPASVAAGADIPVLASATLVFAREGAQGTRGPFVPPPMLWEDYPGETDNDYEYLPGAEGDERLDVVLHGSPAAATGLIPSYMCIRKHKKSVSPEPGITKGWETYWEESSSMGFLATKVLLADTANIGLTATQAVRVYDEAAKIVGEFSGCSEPKPLMSTPGGSSSQTTDNMRYLPLWFGGEMNDNGTFAKNPTFAVDKNGMVFIGGFNSGRRIIIDPNNKGSDGKVSPRITLFDADGNQRVMIDGESHSIGQVYNNGEQEWYNVPGDTYSTADVLKTTPLGTVKVGSAGGHLIVSLKLDWGITSAAYSPGGTTQSVTQTVPRIHARIRLLKGGSEVDSADFNEVGHQWLNGVGLPASGTPATQSKSGTVTLKLDTHLGSGEYTVQLVRSISHKVEGNSTTNSGASASVGVKTDTFAHTYTAGSDYKAFLGADSLLIARTATEYFRCGVTEGGALIVEARVNDHGIRINNGGVYARNRTTGTWEAMYVTCETTAADANACVCDQIGQRVFLTDNSTVNLPNVNNLPSKYGAITTVTLNTSADNGTHIQEWRMLGNPVQCYARSCVSGTWGTWTKVY